MKPVSKALGTDKLYKKPVDAGVILGDRLPHEDGEAVGGAKARKGQAIYTIHEHSFKCGPFALRTVRETLGLEPFTHPLIEKKRSERVGISLLEVEKLAQDMGMDWVAVTRKVGEPLPVPAVVHWKVGHYAAVVQRKPFARAGGCALEGGPLRGGCAEEARKGQAFYTIQRGMGGR